MKTKTFTYFKLLQEAWFDEEEMEIALPADWEIFFADIPADSLPVLSDEEIEKRLSQPIGTKTLSELAGNRQRAVIIFDDLSRPTNAAQIAPGLSANCSRPGSGKRISALLPPSAPTAPATGWILKKSWAGKS